MIGNDAEPQLPDDVTKALPRIAEAVANVVEECVGKRPDVKDVTGALRLVADLAKKVADAVKKQTGERHVARILWELACEVTHPGRVVETVAKVKTVKTPPDGIAYLRKTAGKLHAVADIAELLDNHKSLREVDWFLTLAARADDSAMSAIEAHLLQVEKKESAGGEVGTLDVGTVELRYFCRMVCPAMRPNA